jgi:hypothetical protein
LQLLLDYLQPIIGIQCFNGVRECQRLGPLEFSKFVMLLRLWCWLMLWSMLHVVLVGIVVIVLIGDTVASVGHLMIMKRFEIEIEIKDSQLYASRYNDDWDFI